MDPVKFPVSTGTQGQPNLTMRDIAKWHQEEAFYAGEVGFHTNFPNPMEIFKPFTIRTDPSGTSGEAQIPTDAENEAAMTVAMQARHRQISRLQRRRQIMDANKALVSKTELEIIRRLLAAGVSKDRLGADTTLRQKVVQMIHLERPKPEPNFVTVYVEPSGSKGQIQALEINLPLCTSIAEVHALLDEVVVAMLSSKGFSYESGGVWKYQLASSSTSPLPLTESLPLETEFDYKGMLQRILRKRDQGAPVAVLTQVRPTTSLAIKYLEKSLCLLISAQEGSSVRPVDAKEADGGGAEAESHSEDDDLLDILDEDGQPFFEPLDMDRMSKKYASFGEDSTGEEGIHDFER